MDEQTIKQIRKIIDEEGCFKRGPYVGLDLTAILTAMEHSGWDYPSAMAQIGEVLEVREWIGPGHWDMRPSEGEMYTHLIEVCPEVDWRDAPARWST